MSEAHPVRARCCSSSCRCRRPSTQSHRMLRRSQAMDSFCLYCEDRVGYPCHICGRVSLTVPSLWGGDSACASIATSLRTYYASYSQFSSFETRRRGICLLILCCKPAEYEPATNDVRSEVECVSAWTSLHSQPCGHPEAALLMLGTYECVCAKDVDCVAVLR